MSLNRGAALMLMGFLLPVAGLAQSSASIQSSQRARRQVEKSLGAIGGIDGLTALGQIRITAEGFMDSAAEYQGFKPEEKSPGPIRDVLSITMKPPRKAGIETRSTRSDGSIRWRTFAYPSVDQRLIIEFTEKWARLDQGGDFASDRQKTFRLLPHFILEEALRNSASLRWLGGSDDAVSYSTSAGHTLTLLFSRPSARLAAVEYLTDWALIGDTTMRWEFSDYRTIPSSRIMIPWTTRTIVEGRAFKELNVTAVDTAEAVVESQFRPPDAVQLNTRQVPPPRPRVPARAVEVSPGLFYVENIRPGFNVMFASLPDYVVAFDAPTSYAPAHELPADSTPDSVAEEFVSLIKATLPDKSIGYLVITHFHSDHAGGVRPFIREGATIVTGPDTAALLERYLGRDAILSPLPTPKVPKIRIVSDTTTIGAGERRIEIMIVAGNPHAEEMLIGWIPASKSIFEGDLFYPESGPHFPSPNRINIMKFFVDWLDRKGLAPDKIYATHGSTVGTQEHVGIIRKAERTGPAPASSR